MTQAAILAASGSPGTTTGFKNKLINGNMVINQRGFSGAVDNTAPYTLDRWIAYSINNSKYSVSQNAGSVTPPAGFTNYLGVTSLAATSSGASDYYGISQKIEGFNTADLGYGTANAKTVTLSFWVRSSLTGQFGGSFINGVGDYAYPFSYTISSANTWEQKSITVVGPTAGTWVGATNGVGLSVVFSLGYGSSYTGTAGSWSANAYYNSTGSTSVVATNGATFYVTGVQLEVGTTATNFDFRSYGTELQLCQRYFYLAASDASKPLGVAAFTSSGDFRGCIWFPVTMRTNPSISVASGTGYYRIYGGSSYNLSFDSFGIDLNNTTACALGAATGLSGASAGIGGIMLTNNSSAKVSFSAEL